MQKQRNPGADGERRRTRGRQASSPAARATRAALWLVPALVAGALAAPRLGLGYFYDDYFYVNLKGTGDPALFLDPRHVRLDPSITYYRPITQGLYGLFLRAVDPQTGHVGHAINLLLLMACVALLARWVSRLAGPWTAFLAAAAFAVVGATPSLVAWVSGSHDLFAIAFLLLALTFRHDGRAGPAMTCAALALLSKETAVAAFPLLILYDRVLGRPGSVLRPAASYGVVLLAWAAIHPGLHRLLAHGLQTGATGYVGLVHPEQWGTYLVRYLLTLGNIPLTGARTPWPADLTLAAAIALAILAAGSLLFRARRPSRGGGRQVARADVPLARLVRLALVLALPSLLLPVLFVDHWMPYQAVLASPGTSVLLALALHRTPNTVAAAALAVYLVSGVWCRGMILPGESVWSEPVLVDAARSIPLVRKNILTLHPTMPRGAQLLVSIAGTGSRGMTPAIAAALYEGQAPSLWYGDPGLHTARPEARSAGYPADVLLRITRELDVVDLDPVECRYRSTAAVVGVFDVGRPISTYARGVAASGDPDLALRILRRLAELDQGEFRSYDLRIAASVALAYGRREEAERLRAEAPPLERQAALSQMGRVFGDPTGKATMDSCVYWAFGISPDDAEAMRYYLSVFRELGNPRQIEHFARRLDRLRPGDPEAADALQWLGQKPR